MKKKKNLSLYCSSLSRKHSNTTLLQCSYNTRQSLYRRNYEQAKSEQFNNGLHAITIQPKMEQERREGARRGCCVLCKYVQQTYRTVIIHALHFRLCTFVCGQHASSVRTDHNPLSNSTNAFDFVVVVRNEFPYIRRWMGLYEIFGGIVVLSARA